jgi:hypothetical protein
MNSKGLKKCLIEMYIKFIQMYRKIQKRNKDKQNNGTEENKCLIF